MFVTNHFVFLHMPKTGGTFVTTLLERIHQARGQPVQTVRLAPGRPPPPSALSPDGAVRLMFPTRYQHGTRRDIPDCYRDRPVVSSVRNPYDRYVSQFEFAWWRRLPEMFGPVDLVRRAYPDYPDLRFEEFVRLSNTASITHRCGLHPERTPGFHTQQCAEYFFADPDAALPRLCHPREAARSFAGACDGIHFLNQASLNEDLHAFLLGAGYAASEIDAVRAAERIWPPEGGRPADASWTPYYTPELKAFVRDKERLMFERFPQFDV